VLLHSPVTFSKQASNELIKLNKGNLSVSAIDNTNKSSV